LDKAAAGTLFGSITLDRNHSSPLHTQLYNSIRELILGQVLISEQRLPSTRVLASELAISRTTVLYVYDRLTSEGLLYSKTGAGSFVSSILRQRERTLEEITNENLRTSTDSPPLSEAFIDMVNQLPVAVEFSEPQAFSTAIPAIDVFPMLLWSRIISRHSRRSDLVRYNTSIGYPPLRRAIAAHLRTERGLECRPEQIYITSGAHQAFRFLGEMLIDPGDRVWFENPGSRLARNGFNARGAKLIPVPVDEEGLDVQAAIKKSPDFRLASVTPSHQQPCGSIMSLSRRLELLNAADKANAWIIEDDFDGEFFYAKQPLPTLFSVARNKRVIYVGTFSKSMFPSLRLGYFVVPDTLIEKLNRSVNSYLPEAPLMIQAATAEFIEKGHFATHIRRSKKVYVERYRALAKAIRTKLDDYLELIETETGFHALAVFKRNWDERAVADKAKQANLLVRPLSNYCIEPLDNMRGIALGFGCVTPDEIENAVERLKLVFESID
jgi:GntR family transcriptional regulator / MocR family aminotransferase